MSDTIIAHEPEEQLESALCSVISNVCGIPVEGALTPVSTGNVKRVSSETFVSVVVDLASQEYDLARPAQFITLTASIAVHYALADDADGSSYRDECRKVRSAIVGLTGDGCSALSTAGALEVDGFILNSTSTSFEAGDAPVNTKTYTAKINCRVLTNTTEESNV